LRTAFALTLSMVLSACGGGGSSSPTTTGDNNGGGGTGTARFTIGGTIIGNDASVTLSLNGTEETFAASPFTFTQDLASGDQYAVLFVSTPANQQCTISNGVGTAIANVTSISVTCSDPITLLQYQDAEVTGIMTSGDFDGDGFTDLVFTIRTLAGHPTGSNNDMFRVTYGNGAGGFNGIKDIARLGSSDSDKRGHHLIAGDFNGDGIDDFAFAAGNVLELFAGSAAQNHMPIYRVNDITRVVGETLYALDADGDNDLDLVTLNLDPILTTNVAGNFDSSQIFDSNLLGAINLSIGDFNGDGRSDILTIGEGSANTLVLALFAGNASGGFDLPVSVDTLSSDLFLGGFVFDTASKELAAGDFDADGDLDIAITSTTNFVQIMINDGAGSFSAGQRVIVGTRPIHVRAADFDLDGTLDLATINQDSKTAVISLGNGDGTFADNNGSDTRSISILLDPDVDLFDMDVTDIDSDSYPDIILAEDGTNPPNTGRGSVQIFYSPAR